MDIKCFVFIKLIDENIYLVMLFDVNFLNDFKEKIVKDIVKNNVLNFFLCYYEIVLDVIVLKNEIGVNE